MTLSRHTRAVPPAVLLSCRGSHALQLLSYLGASSDLCGNTSQVHAHQALWPNISFQSIAVARDFIPVSRAVVSVPGVREFCQEAVASLLKHSSKPLGRMIVVAQLMHA